MANLIPPQALKRVRREYFARVAAVWLFLIAAGISVVALLLLPVYVLIENQTKAYAGQYDAAAGQSGEFAEISDTITRSNSVAATLLNENRSVAISEYLKVVTGAASDGVTITQFVVPKGTDPIVVGGRASTRSKLAAYKEALEETGSFERVELPISSLASERNIDFSMQLVPKAVQ